MCAPLNRKGVVCSECAEGFGPSITSFGYTKCINCSNAWYGVLLFLFLEFVPITAFYLFILTFQISMTSAPMPCVIMYAQLVQLAIGFGSTSFHLLKQSLLTKSWDFQTDMKIILTFYALFNLDFFQYNTLPPYCLNSNLKSIHLAYLGYISAFYPIFLVLCNLGLC